jgi:DNA repair protein SbcD/Mre11
MKIIILGDLHISGTNPKCRLDDLTKTQFEKLEEVIKYANKYKMNIYQVGDVFDSPNVGYSTYTNLHSVLKRLEHSFFHYIYGNHDLYFHNPKSKSSTPLASLQSTTKNVEHVYNSDLDIDYQNWGEEITYVGSDILICHRAIVSPRFYRKEKGYSLWGTNDITCYSLDDSIIGYETILCGHWHKRYIDKTKDQLIINPGSLTRRDASQDSLDTFPSFVVFDTKKQNYDIVTLNCAKNWEEVISEKHLELTRAKKSMTGAIQEFIDNLKKKGHVNKKTFLEKLNKFAETELNEYETELFQEILESSIGVVNEE